MGDEAESVLAVIGPTALLLSGVALVITSINWLLRRRKNRIVLGVELVIFISALIAYSKTAHWRSWSGLQEGSREVLGQVLTTTWVAALAFVVNALLGRYVLEARKLHDGSPAMPRLLRDLASLGLYAGAGMMVVHFVFNKPVTALAATSGALVFILGYSAQSTLGEVFSGLSLNLAEAFRKGDWVKIGESMGMVVDHNWRALTIRTKDGNLAIVPNSVAAKMTILNYSLPAPESRGIVEVLLDYSIAPARATQILVDAISESPFVLEKPRPKAVPHSYGELGIKYKCKFWCKHGGDVGDAEVDVLSTIWHALERNGAAIAFDRHRSGTTVREPAAKSDHSPFALARRVSLLRQLSDPEITTLVAAARRFTFGPPERIIRQGDEGGSMFLIAEGAVEVGIRQDDGALQVVATLGAGECFGVMSLLTGERRSATVRAKSVCTVFEIEKSALRAVFDQNTGAIEAIAEHVGQMQLDNEQKSAAHKSSREQDLSRKASLVSSVVGRMRDFFAEKTGKLRGDVGGRF